MVKICRNVTFCISRDPSGPKIYRISQIEGHVSNDLLLYQRVHPLRTREYTRCRSLGHDTRGRGAMGKGLEPQRFLTVLFMCDSQSLRGPHRPNRHLPAPSPQLPVLVRRHNGRKLFHNGRNVISFFQLAEFHLLVSGFDDGN